MGCVLSNQKNLELSDGTFIGLYKTLPLGKILYKGSYNFISGEIYDGNFINNKYNGEGIFTTNNFFYKGNFQDNLLNGKGYLKMNEYIYEGDFRKSKIDGMGKLAIGKYEYLGEFTNNIIQGYGKLLLDKKLLYEGRWYKNIPFKGFYYDDFDCYKIDFTEKIDLEDPIIQNIKLFKYNTIVIDYPISVLSAKCYLCKSKPVDIRKCRHLSVCINCSKIYKKCPICSVDLI